LQFSTQLQSGSSAYTAWESHAGEKYTVTPFGLSFTNYKVEYANGDSAWVPATMTVVSRLVTAETTDRTYTEWRNSDGTIDYRSGGEGAYHDAQIVFRDSANSLINNPKTYYALENGAVKKDVFGVIADTDMDASAPNRSLDTLVYAYQASANVPLGSAPRKAGDYFVTVPMRANANGAYDYKIVTDASPAGTTEVTLEYSVMKKSLSLSWDSRNLTADGRDYMQYDETLDGTNKTMSVTRVTDEYGRESGFIGEIMSINIAYRNEVQEEIREGSALGEKLYTRTNHKFEICIYASGEYNVFVALTTTASENYEWRGGSVSMEQLRAVFSTDGFAITSLTIGTDGRWTYDPAATAPSPKYTLSNGVSVTDITLEFSYAPITLPAKFNTDDIGKLIDTNSWKESDFGPGAASANVPTLAGTYLLKAHYPRTDLACSDAYCVFVIERKEVARPRIEAADAVFNDGDRILKLTYNVSLFDCLYGGTTQTLIENGNPVGIIVTQFDQGTYNVSFRINPDVADNYTLTDLADAAAEDFGNVRYEIDGSTVTFVWTVAPATDHTVSLSDTSVLENLVYGRSYGDPAATASYHGAIKIEYLVDGVWTTDRPVAANTYKVRAVSAATPNYYAKTPGQAAISGEFEFTIARETLTVTPYGTAVYGVPFSTAGGAGYRLEYSGFQRNDDESDVSGQGTYRLVTVPAHMNAGEYALTLVTNEESGFVTGLSADNYVIVVKEGVFTVTPKNISVTVGEISATYGDEIDLTHFTAYAAALEYGEEIGVLGITLSFRGSAPEGGMKRTVGVYQLNADWDNDNYTVTFLSHGVYVVSAMDIRIEIAAGGGVYLGNIVGATVTSIVKVWVNAEGIEQTESIAGRTDIRVPQFTFGYYGTANDSAAWNYDYLNVQTAMPTLAGNYTAIAQGTETNNFNLLNSPSVAFVIARREIDGSLITTQDGVYTGSELTPVINENGYEDLYTPAFGSYVNAGTYEVTLTLNDPANYKWASVDIPERTISFRIVKGELVFTTGEEDKEVVIEGWTFGETANAPVTQTQLGDAAEYVYYYSKTGDENGNDWTTTVPSTAGTWYVRVSVPQTENYNPQT
ncbi:MAG: hypothetical protein K2H43_03015, partial [Clostridia bacterium]|nr:hypothetical protein [Clostridia bacterium]